MKKSKFNDEGRNLQETFRELRKARGYTQSDISDDIISRSLISKFENGATMLTADKLLHIIEKLHMIPNEFTNVLNGYQPDSMQKLYDTLNNVRFSGFIGVEESESLIISKPKNKFQILTNIMIKSILQDITKNNYVLHEEKLTVGDYLSGIDNWTEFELRLLYYTCPIIDVGDLKWFGELLLDRMVHFYHGGNKHLFLQTLTNLYDSVLEYEALEEAEFFRYKISQLDLAGNLSAIVNIQILNDLHDYLVERTEKNLIKAEIYLDKVAVLGIQPIIDYCKNRLERLRPPKPNIN